VSPATSGSAPPRPRLAAHPTPNSTKWLKTPISTEFMVKLAPRSIPIGPVSVAQPVKARQARMPALAPRTVTRGSKKPRAKSPSMPPPTMESATTTIS